MFYASGTNLVRSKKTCDYRGFRVCAAHQQEPKGLGLYDYLRTSTLRSVTTLSVLFEESSALHYTRPCWTALFA